VIIATAGHVDHGKTSLVRQLTGVETDRLAEEQRRGLTISLGYAYLPQATGTPLGFIDVPGHQRFINNMISGISGIDTGLLVIAADDGPMPQTHEHLDVLQLLGVERLVVAISKIDRVTPEQLEAVENRVEALLATRPWSDTAVFPVSNSDGGGIERLKSHLIQQAGEISPRSRSGHFRVAIDRAFVARGAGLIVTGTASAGTVNTGDTLRLLPQNLELRVRGIRVHDEAAEHAMAGQRCALNMVGKIEAAAISRGDWLVGPGAAPAGCRLDVAFSLLQSAPFALKHLSPVKMYIGASRVAGRLALLDTRHAGNRLLPGANCLAQLILDADVACFHGERFLLRDHAENVILGGGTILDPHAPRSGKSRPGRLAWLRAMQSDSPAAALSELMAQGQLVDLDRFRQAWNLRDDEALAAADTDTKLFSAEGGNWAVSQQRWAAADSLLMAHVDQWHQEKPQLQGIKATEVKPALLPHCESPLLMAALTARLQSGDLVLREGRINRAGFQAVVSGEATRHWQQLQHFLQGCGNQIPLLSEISAQTGMAVPVLDQVAVEAARRGELHSLTARRYALPAQLQKLACDVLSVDESGKPITVVAVKSRFGTGRNLTVEILEFFDRIHFTRRQGNTRVILDPELPAKLFSG